MGSKHGFRRWPIFILPLVHPASTDWNSPGSLFSTTVYSSSGSQFECLFLQDTFSGTPSWVRSPVSGCHGSQLSPLLGQVILSQAAIAPSFPHCSCLCSHSLLTACSSSLEHELQKGDLSACLVLCRISSTQCTAAEHTRSVSGINE